MDLKNPTPDEIAERSVLSGILHYGEEAYLDTVDILNPQCFTSTVNETIYNCIKQVFEKKDEGTKLDPGILLSASQECGYGSFFTDKKHAEYLRGLFNFGGTVDLSNVRLHAGKIRKLQIAKDLQTAALRSAQDLGNVKGTETAEQICFLAEEHLIKEMDKLFGQSQTEIKKMSDGLADFVQNLIDNPQSSFGIPNQYKEYCKAIGGGHIRKELDIIAARAKQGKAAPLDSIVYTRSGPKLMKDIKIGDFVCHPDGYMSKVIQIHPQGIIDKYEVTFQDNTKVYCSKQHLWEVKHFRKKKTEVLSLEQIIKNSWKKDGRLKYGIKTTQPVYFDKKSLPLHPYLLGCLLGDGGLTASSIILTSADEELVNNCNLLLNEDYVFKKKKSKYQYCLTKKIKDSKANIYIKTLVDLGLMGLKSNKKFIPEDYLHGSIEQRFQLLQGLMDTDGHAAKDLNEYSTKSKKLAEQVKKLAESLGYLVNKKRRITSCNGKNFYSYRLHIKGNNCKDCFTLKRKTQNANTRKKPYLKRWIKNIRKVGQCEMQCITVDRADGLYLMDNYVVTHNSFFADNIGFYIAETFGIEVINLDTELSQEQHWIRLLGIISGVDMNEIKTGQFAKDPDKLKAVQDAKARIEKVPYKYECIGHRSFEDALAILRRWVNKHVGVDENGRRKDCLIIYDYIKLLSEDGLGGNMAEYQKLGFLVTALKNFLIRYDVPCLAFAQLNRDGIDSDSTSAMAGSDRILMYCSSLAFFKPKTTEEIGEDGSKNGNRKLHVVAARNGPGTDNDNWINVQFDKSIGRITEINTQETVKADKAYKQAFGYEGDGEHSEIDLS